MPFVLAVNLFDGLLGHHLDYVRWALNIATDTPVTAFDARDRETVLDALLAVLHRSLARAH